MQMIPVVPDPSENAVHKLGTNHQDGPKMNVSALVSDTESAQADSISSTVKDRLCLGLAFGDSWTRM